MDSVYSSGLLLHNSAARGMFDRDKELTGMLGLRLGWAWVYDSVLVLEMIDERVRWTEIQPNGVSFHCDSAATSRRHRDHPVGREIKGSTQRNSVET